MSIELRPLWTAARIFSGQQAKVIDGAIPLFGANGIIGHTQTGQPGDVVLVGRVGSVGATTLPTIPFGASDNVLVCEVNPAVLDRRWLFYWLSTRDWSPHVAGTAQPLLTSRLLGEQRITQFDLDAQRRIADMLDTETARIDTLIEKNRQVVGLLAARAARVLEDEVFCASSRPVGIHYLATYVNGFPFKPEDRSDEGTPIVRIAQLLGDTREQDFYAGTPDAYCHIDSGDLIFSWSATLAAKIWDGGPAFLNQHLFKVEPHEHVDRDWLLHALNATVPRMKALTHGSTMTHITRPMMTKIRVPKPSLPEQRIIAERIAVRFAQLGALRATIDRQQELLRLRRRALITAAVNGQIEV